MAVLPSACVPEQEDVQNKGTGDPHLLSNVGERWNLLVVSPKIPELFVTAASPDRS